MCLVVCKHCLVYHECEARFCGRVSDSVEHLTACIHHLSCMSLDCVVLQHQRPSHAINHLNVHHILVPLTHSHSAFISQLGSYGSHGPSPFSPQLYIFSLFQQHPSTSSSLPTQILLPRRPHHPSCDSSPILDHNFHLIHPPPAQQLFTPTTCLLCGTPRLRRRCVACL